MLEKLFKLKENKTTVKTEVMAGLTTFMTMAYILAVNPTILADAGMDRNAVLVATALASFIGTMCMAFMANYPFALAPGMGLNAFMAYTVCLPKEFGGMGYDWRVALAAVALEGVIFIVLSVTNVREAIFNSIPMTLKSAVGAGIGLFIAFIGMQNAKIVVANGSTCVSLVSFGDNFRSVGIGALLAIVGVIITAVLYVKNVKGSIFFGIIITWIIGLICELTGLYVPDAELGMYTLIPNFKDWFVVGSISKTAGQVFKADFSTVKVVDFIVVMFSFLFVDMFDTLGTLVGVASKSNMLDENGKLPRIKGALLADSIATTAGALLGTSTTTTYVESASGVSAGGRTGLTAATSGVLFLLALLLAPVFTAIPSFATAPALIVVGFLMLSSILKVNFDDASEAIPAYICIIFMAFSYSISEGIAFGVISYVLINLITGKAKKISPVMYILAVLFVCKYIFL